MNGRRLGALALGAALVGCSSSGGALTPPAAATTSTARASTSTSPPAPATATVATSTSVTYASVTVDAGTVPTTATATTSATTTAASAPPSVPSTATVATTAVPPPLLAGLATDPARLAAQLTAALRTTVDPTATPDAVTAAGRRQQLVYRRLAARPEWQEATVAAVEEDLRPFVANDVAAVNAPGDATLAKPVPPLETLPAWTIRPPLPADELLGYYREAEAATGIPWPYLAAINLVETRMGRIVGLSSADAVGPMQFLRSTWNVCCTGDPTVDRDAVMGAAVYLRRRGGPDDMRRAVLGYNPNDAYLAMIDHYVANLSADERLYRGYHAWEVFVATTAGPLRLPVGYRADVRVPAADYATAHPEDRA